MDTSPEVVIYKQPFLIYRINSEAAYKSAIELAKYILISFKIEKLYIENPNEINVNILFPNDISLQEKTRKKYKNLILIQKKVSYALY